MIVGPLGDFYGGCIVLHSVHRTGSMRSIDLVTQSMRSMEVYRDFNQIYAALYTWGVTYAPMVAIRCYTVLSRVKGFS